MKVSELIADAERTLKEFGDIPVGVPEAGCGCCSTGELEQATTRVERYAARIWVNGTGWTEEPAVFVVA